MLRLKNLFFSSIFLISSCCSPLAAQEGSLTLGGGYFDIDKDSGVGLFQAEYKFGYTFFCQHRFLVRPHAGFITPGFYSFFGYMGASFELYVTDHFICSALFSPGIYIAGKGKKLGCPIEFRSGVELAYRFRTCSLGVQFNHISNASLGCHNPGANYMTAFIGFPL